MRKISIIALAMMVSACMSSEEQAKNLSAAEEIAFADVEKVGKPIDCLQTFQIRSTDVVSNRIVDFEVGRKTYRNVLPNRCSGLTIEDAFAYETSIGKLCSVDMIKPLQNVSNGIQTVGACGLGKFQEIRKREG